MSPVTVRNFAIALAILLLASGVLAFMLYKINGQQALLEEQVKTVTEQQGQENSLFRLKRIAEESEADRTELQNSFLRNQGDSITFLNSVESLAPQIGVTLETNSLNQLPVNKEKENWIEVKFSYSGSRESVGRFTTALENLPYVSYITSYQLSAETTAVWKVEVTMLVFVLAYDA